MQLLMQIQCNHSQKQTKNEQKMNYSERIVKINQQSNTGYNSLNFKNKK